MVFNPPLKQLERQRGGLDLVLVWRFLIYYGEMNPRIDFYARKALSHIVSTRYGGV
jgi:hypothetical protein